MSRPLLRSSRCVWLVVRSRVARGGGGPNRLGAVQHPALRLGPRRNALLGGRISHAMESPAELGATCFRVMPAPRNRRVSNGSTRRGSSRVQLHIPLTLRCGLEVAQRVWCCSRLGGRGSARRGPTGHDDPPRAQRCDASARQSPFPKVSTGELGKKPRGGTRCGAFCSSVGASGFEPPTSWSRTRRANRAALRPELLEPKRLRG